MKHRDNGIKSCWLRGVVMLALTLAGYSSRAVNYNPGTTLTVYIHGFDSAGYTRVGIAGDDTTDSTILGDANTIATMLGAPTWQANPAASNCVVAATYYGDALPTWYTAQDIADDTALGSTYVPRYALRMARYIRYCLNRAPSATSVHVVSASFGCEISRYLIEHNLLNLCSDQMISRWSPIVGVVRGNWASGSSLANLASVFGATGADSPDIPQMTYSWVNANISANTTLNSPYYGPMIINQFTATDDGSGYVTLLNNNANDTVNMVTDEYFAGYTTPAALHPTTDGTLQMPGLAYYLNTHSAIRSNTAMWASVAAAAQNNVRVTINLSRFKALVGDAIGNGEWVYSASVVSPRSAALYGNTVPIQNLNYADGVSPKFLLAANQTINPNTALFDMIIPPGETQLQVTFTVYELDNMYNFYNVVEFGGNTMMGTFTLTISTTEGSTVTVSNGNLQADLTTTIKSVYCAPTIITGPADRTVTNDLGLCSAVVNLGLPLATNDNCGILTVTNNAPATFPVGTSLVTWTAVDTSGNTATCVQTVTVVPSSAGNLAISYAGGMVVITWNGGGVLQQADDVLGTYTDVAGAAAPTYTIAPSAAQRFYRLRCGSP